MKAVGWGFFFMGLTVLWACKKDNDSNSISSDEAAEQIALAFGGNSAGLVLSIEKNTNYTADLVDTTSKKSGICGFSASVSKAFSNTIGASISYSFTYNYNYLVACLLTGIADTMKVDFDYTGNFSSKRFQTQANGTGSWIISDIGPDDGFYNFNGSFVRNGNAKSLVANQNSIESITTIKIIDVLVRKTDGKIWNGTASITISGSVPDKGAFSYSASLTFNGDNTATMAIGTAFYSIDIVTGVSTRID
jgi:hypothetical protein